VAGARRFFVASSLHIARLLHSFLSLLRRARGPFAWSLCVRPDLASTLQTWSFEAKLALLCSTEGPVGHRAIGTTRLRSAQGARNAFPGDARVGSRGRLGAHHLANACVVCSRGGRELPTVRDFHHGIVDRTARGYARWSVDWSSPIGSDGCRNCGRARWLLSCTQSTAPQSSPAFGGL
jgi:hypothetical protein